MEIIENFPKCASIIGIPTICATIATESAPAILSGKNRKNRLSGGARVIMPKAIPKESKNPTQNRLNGEISKTKIADSDIAESGSYLFPDADAKSVTEHIMLALIDDEPNPHTPEYKKRIAQIIAAFR